MTHRPTRREFLARSVLLAAGVSTLTLIRPAPSFARSLIAEDLVDAGESLRRGGGREVALGFAPDGTAALRAARDGGVFTSRVLQSSIGFTHLGLHWSAAVPPHAKLSFEVRTSPDGSKWSPWSAAHLQRLPEETPAAVGRRRWELPSLTDGPPSNPRTAGPWSATSTASRAGTSRAITSA